MQVVCPPVGDSFIRLGYREPALLPVLARSPFLDNLFMQRFNLGSNPSKRLALCITVPSDSAARVWMPRSSPVSFVLGLLGSRLCSVVKIPNHLFVAVFLIVNVLRTPRSSLCFRMLISPIFERASFSLSSNPYCGYVMDRYLSLHLNRGKPALIPISTLLKNPAIDFEILWLIFWSTWAWTQLSSGTSCFSVIKWLFKPNWDSVFPIRPHTNLQCSSCRLKTRQQSSKW